MNAMGTHKEYPGIVAQKKLVELKKMVNGITKARDAAQLKLASETLRADISERALRDAARDRDHWRKMAEAATAELNSLKGAKR